MLYRSFGWLFSFMCTSLVATFNEQGDSKIPSPQKDLAPFRVGVFLPSSGPLVDYGSQARQGVDYAAHVLKKEGVALEMFFEDTQGSPTGTSLAVNKLLSTHKVHMLLGEMTTANTDAAIAPAITSGVPLISLGSTYGPLIKNKPLVHLVSVTDCKQAKIMAQFAKEQFNAQTAAVIVNTSSDYSKDMANEFTKAFLSLGKNQNVNNIPLSENTVSYTPYIRKLKKNNKYVNEHLKP